jgi:hypothetical protein
MNETVSTVTLFANAYLACPRVGLRREKMDASSRVEVCSLPEII